MFQPTKEWVNKVNLSSFELENFFKFGACVISARKAKQLDATTMFTYSHANTALGQSERAYYLSYFIIYYINTNEIRGELSRENMISSHVKITCYLHHPTRSLRTADALPVEKITFMKITLCSYSYITNRAFRS